jgi:3-oxoadipate enol-lactonase
VPYCDVNGVSLYYESHGVGLPIVFVHGLGGNHASWFKQIHAFAVDHRVVVYDQRGFGNSTDPQRLGRNEMVNDLAALLNSLQIEQAVFVGQSMGGGTCAGFTCRHPKRVTGLVLADTLAGIELPEEVARMVADASCRAKGLTQSIRILGRATRERFPEQAILYAELASFNEYDVTNIPGFLPKVGLPELAQTSVPILYLVGSDDILFPPACVRLVHQQTANSQFVELTGVGHSAYFEDAKAFNDALRRFIAGLNPL